MPGNHPKKYKDCVDDVKAKGGAVNPYAVCHSSTSETKEVNQNRQDPYPSPDIKKGKVEPVINKTTKGIGGLKGKISELGKQQETILYKQVLDAKLRQHATPRK